MNERLRELYQQAHATRRYEGDPALEGNPPTVYWQGEASAEKFAQLIVRECCEVIHNLVFEPNDIRYGDDEIYQDALKKHFNITDTNK